MSQVSAYLAKLTVSPHSPPLNVFIALEDLLVHLKTGLPSSLFFFNVTQAVVFIPGYRSDVDISISEQSTGHFSFSVAFQIILSSSVRVALLPECKSLCLALM